MRATAESIQNGLQLARAEAVRRNAAVSFYLTSSVDAGCVISPVSTNWVITFGGDDPTGNCGKAPMNDALPPTDPVNTVPRVIQRRSAAEGSSNVVTNSNVNVVSFNGLGRGTPASIDVDDVSGVCTTTSHCLRVTVTNGGQVRVCDRALNPAGIDPQRCLVGF